MIFIFMIMSCHDNNESSADDHEKVKALPDEWLLRQRMYPSGEIDDKAYKDGLAFRAARIKENQAQARVNSFAQEWEFAGPTSVGGRITDVEISSESEFTFYAGAASGGIFKTYDGGTSWIPLFDDQTHLAIGDIAIAPSDNQILYVGTGEPNAGGGSLAYDGNGVHRSDDGGETWKHLGLDEIGSTGKIVIDPSNPDRCFAAGMGKLFRNDEHRGVFKTEDGGDSWEKVLYINDSTGIIDLAMNFQHPDTIYAAAWQRTRRVNKLTYGGISSGIFKSTDGGDTWIKLVTGLPESSGRIGIDISRSNPAVLYAMHTDPVSGYLLGIYRSVNHGTSWTLLGTNEIDDYPYMWWFGKIFVDPSDHNTVFCTSFDMYKSTDGGNNWGVTFNGVHGDQHSVSFDPNNPDRILIGNDGGAYLSSEGGWGNYKLNTLPVTQFYSCEYDALHPERLYGGAQDNGTNRTLSGNHDEWDEIYFGDGMRVLVDPVDNKYVYAELQNGQFARSINGGNSFMGATPSASGLRRNWNTPYILDPNHPEILYYGANRLFKSTDRAASWNVISPDLTKNMPGFSGYGYGTITAIAASAIDSNIIIVGTDDGNLQVTSNGGADWHLRSSTLPNRWVTSVATDPNNAQVAYVTYSGFRHGENMGHIFQTSDLGETWLDITGNLPDIPINDLIVLPSGMLILATDVGVYYSLYPGTSWEMLGTGLPSVVITDLTYHDTGDFILAATYGRGMYKYNIADLSTAVEHVPLKVITEFSLYPNPCFDYSTLSMNAGEEGQYKITIFNISGEVALTISNIFLHKGTQQRNINLSALSKGLYICVIGNSTYRNLASVKLIKI